MKRIHLCLMFCLLLVATLCFAEMSIFLKNGGDYRVRKIVFNGQQAELHLPDGRVITMPVSDIDLDASGIGSPVGTYGETTLGGGSKPVARPKPMVNETTRQAQLKDEWNSSERSAVAIRDVGSFHTGEVVRIVDRDLSPDVIPMPEYYLFDTPPEVQKQLSVEQSKELQDALAGEIRQLNTLPADQVYVIIYKNPDGTFGKKMMDSATFTTNFKIVTTAALEPPKSMTTPPDTIQPPVSTTPQQTPPENTPPGELEKALQKPHSAPPMRSSSTTVVLIAVVLLVAAGGGVGVFVTIKKRKKPFVDSSKFRTYEEELRDFEIEIWLKNGRPLDQLMDICVKKFYQDNPGALSVAMKMLKGTPKSSVLPYLIKQAETDTLKGEAIYGQMERRIDWIRAMIQTVSNRTGITPGAGASKEAPKAAPPPASAAPSAAPPVPKSPQAGGPSAAPPPLPQAGAPAPPPGAQPSPPAPKTSAPAWEGIGRMVSEHEETPLPSNLPPYFKSIFRQLGTLGS